MKILIRLLFIMIPLNCYAQELSIYGLWNRPPESIPFYEPPPPIFDEDIYFPEWETETYRTPKISQNIKIAISPLEPEVVLYPNTETFGTVIIQSKERALYYTLTDKEAYRYPIGVGREGFDWSGVETVSRIQEWPEWIPPKEMLIRRPELPERMNGGIKNPLGAVAIYLGNSLYRIHGTNDPKSIGRAESSGCFRMLNEHAVHLASIVGVGTVVKVYR